MGTIATETRPYFPSSKAGLLAGVAVIALGMMVGAAQSAGSWPFANTATMIVMLSLVATVPRGITAKGEGLRGPISQRRSGWIYLSVIGFGLTFITTTLMTGQPLWSLVAGIVLAVGTLAALLVIMLRRSATEAGSVDD